MSWCPLVIALLAQAPGEPRDRLAVLDLEVSGFSPAVGASLSSNVAAELSRLDVVEVTSAETVRTLLGVERQRQLMGASSTGLDQLASTLDARYLATGRVTAVAAKGAEPKRFALELNLIDARAGTRLSTQTATVESEIALFTALRPVVYRLTQPLLAGKTGHLTLSSREVGATVKVDDTVVGTTPLPGRLEVKAGPHLVAVEKESFVRDVREVKVAAGGVSQLDVRLAPSPDFARTYESKAQALRIGAWAATGTAIAGALAFGAGQLLANATYGSAEQRGTFAWHRSQLVDGPGEPGVNHLLEAQRLRAQIGNDELLSTIGAVTAAAAAVTAVVLWLIGDPPGAYAQYAAAPGGAK